MRRFAAVVAMAVALLPLPGCGGLAPGSVDPGAIADPTTIDRPSGSRNSALACPEGACAAGADWAPPTYAAAPDRLYAAWREAVAAAPRTTIVAEDPARLLLLAQQRSAVFRFVDTITVRVLPAEGGGSTFAALSRSEVGYGDLGVNGRRLKAWQEEVGRRVGGGSP